jgi:hypothetical protein
MSRRAAKESFAALRLMVPVSFIQPWLNSYAAPRLETGEDEDESEMSLRLIQSVQEIRNHREHNHYGNYDSGYGQS